MDKIADEIGGLKMRIAFLNLCHCEPEIVARVAGKLTEHPDLILWIIQNDSLIKEGFKEVLINAVRNGENIINTLKALKVDYE